MSLQFQIRRQPPFVTPAHHAPTCGLEIKTQEKKKDGKYFRSGFRNEINILYISSFFVSIKAMRHSELTAYIHLQIAYYPTTQCQDGFTSLCHQNWDGWVQPTGL